MSLISKVRNKMLRSLREKDEKISYSQCGEDLIVEFVFGEFRMERIRYMDIGAHHPTYINNTMLFYAKGSTGVSIEPDPYLYENIRAKRPNDTSLNIGIGLTEETALDFYILSERTLNTFSKEEAERYASYGNKKIEKVIKMPVMPVNDIIKKYFSQAPDFISLDVEGLDLAILKTFDFETYRPKVWCIETLTYTEDKTEVKVQEIIDHMLAKGYFLYADTYINSIFVDREAWTKR